MGMSLSLQSKVVSSDYAMLYFFSHLPCDVVASRRHFSCVFVRIRFFTAPGCLACLDNCAEQNQYAVATLEAQSWCPMASKSAHQPLRLRASQRPQPENSYHHVNHAVITIILSFGSNHSLAQTSGAVRHGSGLPVVDAQISRHEGRVTCLHR